MSVFSLCLGRMLYSWMRLFMQVMSLVHGLSGLVLLRLRLLTLTSSLGGLIPSRGLVLGRGSALFRVVRLGGDKVRKASGNAADAHDAAGVFLYRDSSLAPLLDMRRRFKAVMVVLGAMIQHGVSLSRSFRTHCSMGQDSGRWSLYPVTISDLSVVGGLGIGDFHRVVADTHHRLSDFIHAVLLHRRDEAIRRWRVHPNRWLRPDLVPPAPFLQCKPHLTPGGSGLLADPAMIDEEFRKACFPTFVATGKEIPAMRNSIVRSMGGYRFYLRLICPG